MKSSIIAFLIFTSMLLQPSPISVTAYGIDSNIQLASSENESVETEKEAAEQLDKELNSTDEISEIVDNVDAQGTPKLILGEFSKMLKAIGDTIQPTTEVPSFNDNNITEFKGPTGGTFCKIIDKKDAIYVQIPNLDKTYKISSESIENYFYGFIEDKFNMKIKR